MYHTLELCCNTLHLEIEHLHILSIPLLSLCAPIMVIMTLEAIPWSTLVPIALPITRLTFPGHQDINHTIITAQMLRLWITQWWQKLTLSPRLTFIRAKWFSKTIKTFKYTNIRIDILVLFPFVFLLFSVSLLSLSLQVARKCFDLSLPSNGQNKVERKENISQFPQFNFFVVINLEFAAAE